MAAVFSTKYVGDALAPGKSDERPSTTLAKSLRYAVDLLPTPALVLALDSTVLLANAPYVSKVSPRSVRVDEVQAHWRWDEPSVAVPRGVTAAPGAPGGSSDGAVRRHAVAIDRGDGNRWRVVVDVAPLLDASDRPAALLVVVRDREAEAAVEPVAPVAPTVNIAELDLNRFGFTGRERTIVERLLQGQRVASIARDLFLSEHTVRNHLRGIFRKAGVATQRELVDRLRTSD